MIFHYSGTYSGDESTLPQRTQKGAVPYKEIQNIREMTVKLTVLSAVILVIALALMVLRAGRSVFGSGFVIGVLASCVTMFPHECLHALWFPGDVYMYTMLRKGMLFVVGTSDFSKARFIAMSLCPNVVFGLIPYVLFMIFPSLSWVGFMGAFCIAMGAGDYYNVFNCACQVPKGGMSFMSGMHTYWYLPKK